MLLQANLEPTASTLLGSKQTFGSRTDGDKKCFALVNKTLTKQSRLPASREETEIG